jgi:hypothetical protein
VSPHRHRGGGLASGVLGVVKPTGGLGFERRGSPTMEACKATEGSLLEIMKYNNDVTIV